MADVSGPFDNVQWAEAEWYRHMPAAMKSGVIGVKVSGVGNGPLGWTASGLNVTLTVGNANVGGAGFSRTAPATAVTVPANTNSSLSRRDRLVLRRSLGTKTVVPTIITGTAASSPVAPAVTMDATTFDLKMFSFLTPPNSGTTLTSVIDERTWVNDGTAEAQPGTNALLEGTGTQTLVHNAATAITLGTLTRANGMTISSGLITADSPGLYMVTGMVSFAVSGTGRRIATVYKNGASVLQAAHSSDAGLGPWWRVPTASYPLAMNAGDSIQLYGYQDSGGNLDVNKAESFLSAHWIGPL